MLQKTTLHCSSKWTSPSTVFSCLNPELKMDISCLFKNVFIYFGNTYSFTFLSHNTSQLQPPSPPSSPYAQVKEPKHVNREPSADHYGHPDGHRWVSMSPSQLILGNDLHFLGSYNSSSSSSVEFLELYLLCGCVKPEPAIFFNQASTPSGGIVKLHRHKIFDSWQVLAARCDGAMMVLNLWEWPPKGWYNLRAISQGAHAQYYLDGQVSRS